MKIGIQGGPASYHEAAAKQLHPTAEIVYYATFSDLFKALQNQEVTTILAAIANNRVQFIQDTYEFLVSEKLQHQVVGEIYLRVEHALLAPKGARLDGITEVHSQVPAIGQCSHFLENVLPQAHVIEESDTALAAKLVAQDGGLNKAAIASEAAAKLYDLEILKRGVQDDPDNITRFLEIRLKDSSSKTAKTNKTTMILYTPQVAGALVDALLPFKEEGIHLSSLQSRLIPNSAFDMQFFIEFDAGLQEDRTKRVLSNLSKNKYEITILGSYMQAVVPIGGANNERHRKTITASLGDGLGSRRSSG